MRYLQIHSMIEAVSRAGSIRKAAADLNITSSALNRRIQGFEDEFGYQIFERLPRGVRLNPAGELLIQHIRHQSSELERLRSQVADLSGERRGNVSIACSQALLPYFLPEQIARYRAQHPGVTFDVRVRDRVAAERALSAFEADIALVFEPALMADFAVLYALRQPIHAIMAEDHPLAREEKVRLRDCLSGPYALPVMQYGVRGLLEQAAAKRSMRLRPMLESDNFEFLRCYVRRERLIAFQIPIGLRNERGVALRPVSERDMKPGLLALGQARGRTLPVAPARFLVQLATALETDHDL